MLALFVVLLAQAGEVDKCLLCHERMEAITLESGESLALSVDRAAFLGSPHMRSLACTDCHAEFRNMGAMHPVQRLRSRREYAITWSEQCQKCHFSDYKASLDGVHRAQIVKGRLGAAVCSDCHGAHDISPPGNPRTKISLTCARCHEKIAAAYVKSVHGEALRTGNEDVPACTDCHRAHDIEDPRTGEWRLRSPQMCGACHTDAKRMGKYGLSTGVLQTYLTDFHGATARLQSGGKGEVPVVALCTDCHGVHDIVRARDPDSPVMKANLLGTCRKCHGDAGADFPAAWLGHTEPSAARAPLVYAVKVFYGFLIPFMIGGLALQIFLHLWRIVVNR